MVLQFRRVLTTPDDHSLSADTEKTWQALITISQELRENWIKCSPHVTLEEGYWFINDGGGNCLAIKNTDLSSVSVTKSVPVDIVEPEVGVGKSKAVKGSKRRRTVIELLAVEGERPTISDALRDAVRQRQEKANGDVLVPVSEGHTDDTPPIDDQFKFRVIV